MHMIASRKPMLVALTMAVSLPFVTHNVMAELTPVQGDQSTTPLVVRAAVFSADQGRLDNYREFIDGHLFPTLRNAPGYLGTFLGRDPNTGQLISLSFWRSDADAAAAEDAVGRAIRALPPGSAPRPAKVEKYVIELRDVKEPISN